MNHAIDRNITDDYTMQQAVPFEGIVEAVTKGYAKVRFDDDDVVKHLNIFNEFERSKRLTTYMEEGKAWRWL